jgi:hypothetical protein
MAYLKFPARTGAGPGTGQSARASKRRIRRLVLATLFALPMLGACQSTEPLGRIVTPSKVEPSDPPLNPNPQHVVRLHGRAPETLDFRFRIAFLSTNGEGDCWNHTGFWEGGGEKGWGYDLYPVRKGEHWEADLVVDRYLPGRCGWDIRASAMIVVVPLDAQEGDSLGAGTRLVVADARDRDDEAPICAGRSSRCDEARVRRLENSDDALPAQVRCERIPPEKRIAHSTSFICDHFPEHKMVHLLKAHTQRIRIDLYDLDLEATPADEVNDDNKDVGNERQHQNSGSTSGVVPPRRLPQ